MGYVLLTGSTGMIGRFILRDLAARGIDTAVLVRGADAEARMQAVLVELQRLASSPHTDELTPRPRIIRGDLDASDLALSQADAAWLARNVDGVIHCAGDVSFGGEGVASDVWRTNVEGTANLARNCKANHIDAVSYVSTAFVCGDRQGVIRENESRCGQGFGSVYEEAKLRAEEVLEGAGFAELKIFRPCFVGGDTATGYTSTFHGVYWFALFTALARMRAGAEPSEPWRHDVRIFRDPDERHYIVPVDAVSRAIVELHEDPTAPTGAYHLTPLRPATLALLESALRNHYGYEGVRFAAPTDPETWNETEHMFYDGLKAVGHRYLDGDPIFDCSKTVEHLPWWQSVETHEEYFSRLFAYADAVRFGRGPVRKKQPVPG